MLCASEQEGRVAHKVQHKSVYPTATMSGQFRAYLSPVIWHSSISGLIGLESPLNEGGGVQIGLKNFAVLW
jgi:hypothetical protein